MNPKHTAPPATMSLHEAAERLGVHYMTVYRYIRTGRLAAHQDGRQWRIRIEDVDGLKDRASAPTEVTTRRGGTASRLLERLIAGDEAGSWQVVESALASGADPTEVHLDLLAPALRELGQRWQQGQLSIADEHRASATAHRLVARLGPRFTRPGRKRGTVLIGAVAGELHDLPVNLVADQLRGAGFSVIELGANTPASSFVTATTSASAFCVLLSVTGPGHDDAVRETVAALRRDTNASILVGGAAVPDEATAVGLGSDRWTGHNAREVVSTVTGLLEERAAERRRRPVPRARGVSPGAVAE